MERQVLLYMVAGLVHQSVGYNLAVGGDKSVVMQPKVTEGDEPLFGWSVENFKGFMFVGAPQSGNKVGGGAVYKCPNDRTKKGNCIEIISVRNLRDIKYGWYGASLAAGVDSMYTCAPIRGTSEWWTGNSGLKLSKSRVLGNCFKYDKSTQTFSRATEFRNAYPFNGNNFNQHWAQRGSYGLAATVADDENIVVGAPLATAFQDWTNTRGRNSRFAHDQDYHSGAIVKYANKRQYWPKVDESQFIILDSEAYGKPAEMRNHYKLAGIALDKGKFYNHDASSYIIGAPKADNNLGKVYVCSNCFRDEQTARFGIIFPDGNFEVKPSTENRQIGEKFGASVTACDVNGDGRDDVIVGAPFYSDNSHDSFNTGRVHVFVKVGNGVKMGMPEFLAPNLPKGSRFGTAVACIGDTNGDNYQEVVVGAPYFDFYSRGSTSAGVIFIYQGYLLGLRKEYSQKILASEVKSNLQLRGFGISFSKRGSVNCGYVRAPDCSQCPKQKCEGDCEKKCLGGSCHQMQMCRPKTKLGSLTGLSIGAHMSDKAVHVEFRKVPRFLDVSFIEYPKDIDPKDTNSIMVIFTPKIGKGPNAQFASLDVDLDVAITVRMDANRGRISDNVNTKYTVIKANTPLATPIDFRFVIDQSKIERKEGKPAPISVDVTAKWTLSDCPDTSTNICPILDPKDPKYDSSTKSIIERHQTRYIIVKSGCADTDNCRCDISSKIKELTPFVTDGERLEDDLIQIILNNVDKEPAFGTIVTITTPGSSSIEVLSAGNYEISEEGGEKQIFVVPFIAGSSSQTIPVTFNTAEIAANTRQIKISVEVVPDCPKKQPQHNSVTILVKQRWNVTTTPLYPNNQGVDIFNWDWRNDKIETKTITQTFQIKNKGPSTSGKNEVYVFIPKSNKLLSGHEVKLDDKKCIDQKIKVPGDIQSRSCSFSGVCVIKKCTIPSIEKFKYFNLIVNVDFDLDTAKTLEKPSFDVITSVQTNDHQNPKTTRFWKTTLAYRGESILQQIFNNWYLFAGVTIGLIVLIIICIILYKCNVFNSVRIYKDDLEEADKGKNMEMETT